VPRLLQLQCAVFALPPPSLCQPFALSYPALIFSVLPKIPVVPPHCLRAATMAAYTKRFANSVIVAANARVVLTEPLDATCAANRRLSPQVANVAAALRWVVRLCFLRGFWQRQTLLIRDGGEEEDENKCDLCAASVKILACSKIATAQFHICICVKVCVCQCGEP